MATGMLLVAVALGVLSPPPRSEATPAPAPAARTATRRTRPATPEAILVPSPEEAAASRPMVTCRWGARQAGRGEDADRWPRRAARRRCRGRSRVLSGVIGR